MTDHLDNESENPEPAMSEATEPGWESVSPGHMLRSAREQQDISIEALTTTTSLSQPIIESLEHNQFDQLPQPVFVRGYYRKCAKALNIPEQQLLEAYARWAGAEPAQPLASGPVDVTPHDVTLGSGGPRVFKTTVMVVALLVFIVILWAWLPGFMDSFTRQDNAGTESATEIDMVSPLAGGSGAADEAAAGGPPSLGPTPGHPNVGGQSSAEAAASPGPDIRMAAPAAGSAKPEIVNQETTKQAVEGQTQAPSASADTAAAAGSTAAAGTDKPVAANKLVLEFNHRSWVSVEAGNGTTVLQGLVEADQQRVIKAELPYHIVLGYAPGVNVRLGGRAIEFSGRIEADNTAELTLGSAGQ